MIWRKKPKQSSDKSGMIGGVVKPARSKKRIFLYSLFLVVVLGASGYGIYSYQSNKSEQAKILFTIADKKYTEEDIKVYLDDLIETRGVEREEAINSIRQALVFDYISQKYNITSTDDEIKEAMKSHPNYQFEDLSTNKWAKLVGKRIVVEAKVRELKDDSKKGYVYAFYFGSLVDTDVDTNKQEKSKSLSGAGDPALIQADKDYAKQKADEYRSDLEQKKTSPEDALAKIKTDKKLNPDYGSLSYSSSYGFNDKISWDLELGLPPIVDYLKVTSLETEKPSEIQTAKSHYIKKDSEYESYYFFVYPVSTNNDYTEIMKLIDEHGINKKSEAK